MSNKEATARINVNRPLEAAGCERVVADTQCLVSEQASNYCIVLALRPNRQSEADSWNEKQRPSHVRVNRLRLLRPYKLKVVFPERRIRVQEYVKEYVPSNLFAAQENL